MATVYIHPPDSLVFATADAPLPLCCCACGEPLTIDGPLFTASRGHARHVSCPPYCRDEPRSPLVGELVARWWDARYGPI